MDKHLDVSVAQHHTFIERKRYVSKFELEIFE